MIEAYKNENFQKCVELFIETYNCAPWFNKWTLETAERYLQELINNKRFAGFILWRENNIIGAAFCHEKTWWNNDELYIDEFFIDPHFQRKGYGKIIFNVVEKYVEERRLSSITLLTDRKKPAFDFYNKNGMEYLENLVFMYKKYLK